MRLTKAAEAAVDSHTYPTTTADLIAAHGDVELELPDGAESLGDVLARLPDERLESARDAKLSVYSALGEGAIGRKAYSDRDPTSMGERGHEPLSL